MVESHRPARRRPTRWSRATRFTEERVTGTTTVYEPGSLTHGAKKVEVTRKFDSKTEVSAF